MTAPTAPTASAYLVVWTLQTPTGTDNEYTDHYHAFTFSDCVGSQQAAHADAVAQYQRVKAHPDCYIASIAQVLDSTDY